MIGWPKKSKFRCFPIGIIVLLVWLEGQRYIPTAQELGYRAMFKGLLW
jgi:hypothetical protein